MRRHGWFAALVTLTAIGCGTEAGIFADGDGSELGTGGGAGGSGASGSSTSSGDGGDPTTVGSGGDPTTTGVGGAPSTSSTGVGGEPSTTSSTGVGGNPVPPLACGSQSCTAGNDSACCWDNYEIYGPPKAECVMGSVQTDGCHTSAMGEPQEPGAETRIECQSDVHCGAGTTCCAERRWFFVEGQQIFYYESVTCQQSCSGQNEITLCDPTSASPCQQGVCQQSQLLPQGYFVCGN